MTAEYTNGGEHGDVADLTPPKGLASAEFMVETWREAKRAQRSAQGARHAAETAATHALEACEGIGKLLGEVGELRHEVRRTAGLASMRPPMSRDMRAEATSSHDLTALAERTIDAVNEGIRSPNKTPDEEVRRIFAEEAELARLRRIDRDESAGKARRWRIAEAVLGGLSLAGLIEAVKWIVSLSHHG